MVKGPGADVLYHPVGDLVVDMVHEPLGKRRNNDHDCNFAEDRKQSGKIHIAGPQDQVDTLSHQDRRVKGGCHGHGSQDQRENYEPFIASNVVQDPL